MAQRRMFSMKVVDTDVFLEMPISARLLYYDLSMRADDDGFINCPRKIMKMIGCADDDIKLLIAKKYLIPFETGVCVIKHWHIHNLIRHDRYNETDCKIEKSQIFIDSDSKKYEKKDGMQDVIPIDNQMAPQVRLGKDRLELGKDNIDDDKYDSKSIPPTIEKVKEYLSDKQITCVDPESFMAYYDARGWFIKGVKIKKWTSCITTWVKNNNRFKPEHKKAGHVDKEFSTDF